MVSFWAKWKIRCCLKNVYVVSHPKSGSTLLWHLLGEWCGEGGGFLQDTIKFRHADFSTAVMAKCPESESMPREKAGLRIALLYRDPRDTVVAYYHDRVRPGHPKYGVSLSDFIRDRDFGIASVIDFYKDWYLRRSDLGDFLLMRFEDFCTRPQEELRRMVEFLFGNDGVKLHEKISEKFLVIPLDEIERTASFQDHLFNTRSGYRDWVSPGDADYLDDMIKITGIEF